MAHRCAALRIRARSDSRSRLRLAVHPADRAPHPRAARLLRDPSRATFGLDAIRAWDPDGIILSGGPASVLDDGRPGSRPAHRRAGQPGARHLLRPAAARPPAGRPGREGRRPRVRAGAAQDRARRSALREARGRRGARGLDEPRRPRAAAAAGLRGARDAARARPSPPCATPSGRSGACSSTPRWSTPRAGRRCSPTSCAASAAVAGAWTMETFIEEEIARIRERVGDGRVVCGLSGGVDSSVAAALVHRAIGDQLTCIFVDNGLLRLGERGRGRGALSREPRRAAGERRRRAALPVAASRA